MMLSLTSDEDRLSWWMTAGVAILLIFTTLAAAFAAAPDRYRPATLSRMLTGYPLRFELKEIEARTLARDQAQARMDQIAAEQAQLLGQIVVGDLTTNLDAEEQLGAEQAEAEDLALINGSAPVVRQQAASDDTAFPSFIALDFDLAGGPEAANTIQVEKDVQGPQGILGRIEVRIDNNSSIFVSSDDVLKLLPETERASLSLTRGFIPISSLRDQGVNLRYDPIRDRFVLLR